MKWIQIDAQDDPGTTFAADVPGGVLVRALGPSTAAALTFVPGTSVEALTAGPPASPPTHVDPDALDPEGRAIWDRIAAEDPRVTELTPEQFELVRLAVEAGGQ